MRCGICQHGSVSWKLDLQKWTLYEKKSEGRRHLSSPHSLEWNNYVISFNIKNLHCIWKSIRFGRRRLPLKNHWHSSDARLICRRGRVGGVLRQSMGWYFVSHSACMLLSCEVPLYGMFWFGMVWFGMVWYSMNCKLLSCSGAPGGHFHSVAQ